MPQVTARPLNCQHIPLKEWAAMTKEERQDQIQNNPVPDGASSSSKPVFTKESKPESESGVNQNPLATQSLKRLEDWTENVGNISGTRLRNCIIFQLTVRKKPFWVTNMSVAHVRRHAKALDEETPPGWAPPEKDPLIKVRNVNFDGETIETSYIARSPRTTEERKILLELPRDKNGRVRSMVVKFLADPQCLNCRGLGMKQISTNPDPRYSWMKGWAECVCVTVEEFKASPVLDKRT